jgi:hypothetical protein
MMNTVFRCTAIIFVLFTLAGCAKKLDEATLPAGVKTGNIYYAQVSFQYEKGRHLTTNYRRGILVPINTQVQLQEMTDDDIFLEVLPEHTKLRIENVEKHTGDNTTKAFAKLFAKDKVDLSRFSALEQENIVAGTVAEGMHKKAVIAAIGYPPITETPSLNANQWTYWSSRFNRFIVHFNKDKVAKIHD